MYDPVRSAGRTRLASLLVGVVVLYLTAGFLKCRLYDYEPSALVGFGCATRAGCFAEQNRASLPRTTVVFRSGGYDGQFFYYLGRELFGGPSAIVDSSPFRRARIGLPVLAGPLLAAGELGRAYGLPLTLLFVHLSAVAFVASARKDEPWCAALFAFNPFSLLSFLLCTADGAALSLAVVGALAFESSGRIRWAGVPLFAFALLTKETLVAVPLALGAAALLARSRVSKARLERIALSAVTLVPMVVWWRHVGFSVGLAASHGGLPFGGFFGYLPHVDITRALLALLLVLALAAGALFSLLPASRASGFVLLATAVLISTATAEEYWAATPNIARLFTPIAAAPVLLADVNALRASPLFALGKRVGVLGALVLLLLTLGFVLREATRRPLPFYLLTS